MSGSAEGFWDALRASAQRRARAARTAAPEAWARLDDAGPRRDFLGALQAPGFHIIAEAKRQSPSRGRLALGAYDPGQLARAYEAAGAGALSVLTEPEFFLGALSHLAAARAASHLPILRKDFLLDPAQVAEARVAGADAVLVIVRLVNDEELRALLAAARALSMSALVEVHDRHELERAMLADAVLVGVNNRNLDTFETRMDVCLDLGRDIPREVTAVAESGLKTLEDLARVRDAGYRAALVGEQLMVGGTDLLQEVRTWASS